MEFPILKTFGQTCATFLKTLAVNCSDQREFGE